MLPEHAPCAFATTFPRGPAETAHEPPTNAECGDASACLYGFRIPLTRRSPDAPSFKGHATHPMREVEHRPRAVATSVLK
jgi:hypothetical protein